MDGRTSRLANDQRRCLAAGAAAKVPCLAGLLVEARLFVENLSSVLKLLEGCLNIVIVPTGR